MKTKSKTKWTKGVPDFTTGTSGAWSNIIWIKAKAPDPLNLSFTRYGLVHQLDDGRFMFTIADHQGRTIQEGRRKSESAAKGFVESLLAEWVTRRNEGKFL